MRRRAKGIGSGAVPSVNICVGCRVNGFYDHACGDEECACSVWPICAGYVSADEDRDAAPYVQVPGQWIAAANGTVVPVPA